MDNVYGHQDDAVHINAVDHGIETPVVLGSDERRMHVRAYNYWVSLLGDRSFPSIEDLEPANLADFGPNSILLDFTCDIENPTIQFLGAALQKECAPETNIDSVDKVPARSLVSRLTDHYLQIIANRAPIGFEAEFVNHRGNNTLYRGILMPFSSDDDNIDFIFGVINWKELADSALVCSLHEEIQRSARTDQQHAPLASPLSPLFTSTSDEAAHGEDELDLIGMPFIGGTAIADPIGMIGPDAGLGDHLAAARAFAALSHAADHRSRAALYRALGSAWDFAIIAGQQPADYRELLADAGVKVQQRAPMTAVIKLVFGADYDKSRVTEFAAVLEYAARLHLGQGALAPLLEQTDGGIKGVVKAEREARRIDNPVTAAPKRRHSAQSALENHAPVAVLDLEAGEREFMVLLGCRTKDGRIALLSPLEADEALVGRMIKAIDAG